jgi:hypothetical protein
VRKTRPYTLLSLLSLGFGLTAWTQTPSAPPAERAKVVDAFGTVQKLLGDEKAKWQNVNVGDLLPTQTTLKTGDNSAVLLLLPDQHVFRIGAQTTLQLRQLGKDKEFSFHVIRGRIWSFVRRAEKPAKYEIETPSAVVGVSGTVFSVFHDPSSDQTTVSTEQGEVQIRQGANTIAVPKGFATSLLRNQRTPFQTFPQPEAMRRMWQAIRRQETWMSPNRPLRLDRQVEQRYRPFASGYRERPGRKIPKIRNRPGGTRRTGGRRLPVPRKETSATLPQ